MMKWILKKLVLPTTVLGLLGGCATYSVSEQQMTEYLHDNVSIEQDVGVENIMHAHVAVDDLQVKIGRADADRVSVFANTSAQVQVFNMDDIGLDLDIEFSAIPEYDQETGEIFLKSLRLEQFDERNQQLTPEISALLKPAVSMIGTALSNFPVYKLDNNKVQEALLKSAQPNLVIKSNRIVIELIN